jgi:phosphoribosylformylglycinamidine synthase
MVKAIINISLKSGVLDPEGKAIQNALQNFGFEGINEVRKGKFLEIKLEQEDKKEAKQNIDKMCKQLLANTVIENYEITITD